jgi:hypothetical protein
VKFDMVELTGDQIEILDEFTIKVSTPPTPFGRPIKVIVVTPLAESNAYTYLYESSVRIEFEEALLFDLRMQLESALDPISGFTLERPKASLGNIRWTTI